jgi:hypothetical protein
MKPLNHDLRLTICALLDDEPTICPVGLFYDPTQVYTVSMINAQSG